MDKKKELSPISNMFYARAKAHHHKSKLMHAAILRTTIFLTNPSASPAMQKIRLGLTIEAIGIFNPLDAFASEIVSGGLIFKGLKEMNFSPFKYREKQHKQIQNNILNIFSQSRPAYITPLLTPTQL